MSLRDTCLRPGLRTIAPSGAEEGRTAASGVLQHQTSEWGANMNDTSTPGCDRDWELKKREILRQGVVDRVSNGWRMNFALWSALGAFAALVATRGAGRPAEPIFWPLLVLGVLLAVAYIWFCWETGHRNAQGARKIKKIDEKLGIRCKGQEPKGWRRCAKTYHSQLLQVVVTLVLMSLAGLALLFPPGDAATPSGSPATTAALPLSVPVPAASAPPRTPTTSGPHGTSSTSGTH